MRCKISSFLIMALLLTSTLVKADSSENLGTFRFSEFSLKPLLNLQEENNSEFALQTTYLGFEWRRDEYLRGQLLLGSSDMILPSVWFSPTYQPSFGIVEAYLEGRSVFGEFRAGLVNLMMGYEGAEPEWAWILPPTRFHQQAWMINRDFGFQFLYSTYPFTTVMTVSNGESSMNNPDNKFWYSGLWKVKNSDGYGAQVSAQVGDTTPASTNGSLPSVAASKYLFAFDPTLNAKIRVGAASIYRDDGRSLYLLEAGSGDILQGIVKNSFAFAHLDLAIRLGGDLHLLARYEQDQPNISDYTTVVKASSLGFMLTSKDKLQSFTLFGTFNQVTPVVPSSEVQLIFRLNSRYLD